MDDLARRAVACPGWRWLPGMRWCMPSSAPGPMRGRMIGDDPSALLLLEGWPDLDDPATVGALLALVREAWGCPHLSVVGTSEDWRVDAAGVIGVRDLHSYPTEVGALVAALEAAHDAR